MNNERIPKVGRNDPCPCGSGRKFKRCCGGGDAEKSLRILTGQASAADVINTLGVKRADHAEIEGDRVFLKGPDSESDGLDALRDASPLNEEGEPS